MEDIMKNKLNTASTADPMSRLNGLTLAAVYPGLQCPRCRSREIGLMMFFKGDAIWECRDCKAEFRLLFPSYNRF
jgi:hypothetical protein